MAANDRKSELSAYLVEAILTQALAPGSELDEAALCARFGLSRTPVRDVFRDLAGLGYVQVRNTRGARVAELSHLTLHDFFLAAPMIYSAILRLAARHRTNEQVEELRAAQDVFRAALQEGDAAARTMANHRFHEITGEMAGNVYLIPSFHRLLIDHARIGMTFYRPGAAGMDGRAELASDQHDTIIEAIAARSEEAAAQLAEDHWALSRDQIERFVMPAALDVPLAKVMGERG